MRFYVCIVEYSKPVIWTKTEFPLSFKPYRSFQRFTISCFYIWFKLQLVLNSSANERVIPALDCSEVKFYNGSINQKKSLSRFHPDYNYSHSLDTCQSQHLILVNPKNKSQINIARLTSHRRLHLQITAGSYIQESRITT
jgi:hypothetical protein